MGRRSDPACVKNEPLPPKNIDIPCIELYHELMPSNVLIWGTACKQSCKVLVDTGAAITVISEQFFVDLRGTVAFQTCEKIGCIKAADGSKVPVIGAVRFTLFIFISFHIFMEGCPSVITDLQGVLRLHYSYITNKRKIITNMKPNYNF